MKKQLLTLLLIAIVSVGYGQQTKTITPSLDTVFTTLFPATVTVVPATVSTVIHGYKGGTVTPPPVVVPPPVITGTPGSAGTHTVYNLSGASNQTISGWHISGGSVPCITLNNCHDIHITLCKLDNSSTVGILLTNCYNITIDYNFITNVSTGVYATNSTKGTIVADNNQFLNMNGPFPRGQFVQFNNVIGPGLSVSNNRGENILGSSYPEDAINMYQSGGTAASPIMIVGNWIRGGGPSKTGGGIMTGDSNPNGVGYIVAKNNILVNPGQYGISISGGNNITLDNNQVFGAKQAFTNVGAYQMGYSGSVISSPTISNNRVNFTNAAGQSNGWWLGTGQTAPAGLSTNNWNDKTITAAILPPVIITYQ